MTKTFQNLNTRKNSLQNHKSRDLRMESLEARQLLSVSPATAASDEVETTFTAPADLSVTETEPTVIMNLELEDAPVALQGETGQVATIGQYTFTANAGGTVTKESDTEVTLSGDVSISYDSTQSASAIKVNVNNFTQVRNLINAMPATNTEDGKVTIHLISGGSYNDKQVLDVNKSYLTIEATASDNIKVQENFGIRGSNVTLQNFDIGVTEVQTWNGNFAVGIQKEVTDNVQNVKLLNIDFTNDTGEATCLRRAIEVTANVTGLEISNCTFTNVGGAYINPQSNNVTLTNNTFTGNYGAYNGFVLDNPLNATLTGNKFEAVGEAGIAVSNYTGPIGTVSIENNTFSGTFEAKGALWILKYNDYSENLVGLTVSKNVFDTTSICIKNEESVSANVSNNYLGGAATPTAAKAKTTGTVQLDYWATTKDSSGNFTAYATQTSDTDKSITVPSGTKLEVYDSSDKVVTTVTSTGEAVKVTQTGAESKITEVCGYTFTLSSGTIVAKDSTIILDSSCVIDKIELASDVEEITVELSTADQLTKVIEAVGTGKEATIKATAALNQAVTVSGKTINFDGTNYTGTVTLSNSATVTGTNLNVTGTGTVNSVGINTASTITSAETGKLALDSSESVEITSGTAEVSGTGTVKNTSGTVTFNGETLTLDTNSTSGVTVTGGTAKVGEEGFTYSQTSGDGVQLSTSKVISDLESGETVTLTSGSTFTVSKLAADGSEDGGKVVTDKANFTINTNTASSITYENATAGTNVTGLGEGESLTITSGSADFSGDKGTVYVGSSSNSVAFSAAFTSVNINSNGTVKLTGSNDSPTLTGTLTVEGAGNALTVSEGSTVTVSDGASFSSISGKISLASGNKVTVNNTVYTAKAAATLTLDTSGVTSFTGAYEENGTYHADASTEITLPEVAGLTFTGKGEINVNGTTVTVKSGSWAISGTQSADITVKVDGGTISSTYTLATGYSYNGFKSVDSSNTATVSYSGKTPTYTGVYTDDTNSYIKGVSTGTVNNVKYDGTSLDVQITNTGNIVTKGTANVSGTGNLEVNGATITVATDASITGIKGSFKLGTVDVTASDAFASIASNVITLNSATVTGDGINVLGTGTVNGVTVSGATGTVTSASGGALSGTGSVTITATTADITSTVATLTVNQGTGSKNVTVTDAATSLTATTAVTVGTGTFTTAGPVTVASSIVALNSKTVAVSSGTLPTSGAGTVTLNSTAFTNNNMTYTANGEASVKVDADGVVTAMTGNVAISGTTIADGTYNLASGGSIEINGVTYTASAASTVKKDGTSITTTGTITVTAASDATIANLTVSSDTTTINSEKVTVTSADGDGTLTVTKCKKVSVTGDDILTTLNANGGTVDVDGEVTTLKRGGGTLTIGNVTISKIETASISAKAGAISDLNGATVTVTGEVSVKGTGTINSIVVTANSGSFKTNAENTISNLNSDTVTVTSEVSVTTGTGTINGVQLTDNAGSFTANGATFTDVTGNLTIGASSSADSVSVSAKSDNASSITVTNNKAAEFVTFASGKITLGSDSNSVIVTGATATANGATFIYKAGTSNTDGVVVNTSGQVTDLETGETVTISAGTLTFKDFVTKGTTENGIIETNSGAKLYVLGNTGNSFSVSSDSTATFTGDSTSDYLEIASGELKVASGKGTVKSGSSIIEFTNAANGSTTTDLTISGTDITNYGSANATITGGSFTIAGLNNNVAVGVSNNAAFTYDNTTFTGSGTGTNTVTKTSTGYTTTGNVAITGTISDGTYTLAAGSSISFKGYTFTAGTDGATFTTSGTTISIEGNATVTDDNTVVDTLTQITVVSGTTTADYIGSSQYTVEVQGGKLQANVGITTVNATAACEVAVALTKTITTLTTSNASGTVEITGSGSVTTLNIQTTADKTGNTTTANNITVGALNVKNGTSNAIGGNVTGNVDIDGGSTKITGTVGTSGESNTVHVSAGSCDFDSTITGDVQVYGTDATTAGTGYVTVEGQVTGDVTINTGNVTSTKNTFTAAITGNVSIAAGYNTFNGNVGNETTDTLTISGGTNVFGDDNSDKVYGNVSISGGANTFNAVVGSEGTNTVTITGGTTNDFNEAVTGSVTISGDTNASTNTFDGNIGGTLTISAAGTTNTIGDGSGTDVVSGNVTISGGKNTIKADIGTSSKSVTSLEIFGGTAADQYNTFDGNVYATTVTITAGNDNNFNKAVTATVNIKTAASNNEFDGLVTGAVNVSIGTSTFSAGIATGPVSITGGTVAYDAGDADASYVKTSISAGTLNVTGAKVTVSELNATGGTTDIDAGTINDLNVTVNGSTTVTAVSGKVSNIDVTVDNTNTTTFNASPKTGEVIDISGNYVKHSQKLNTVTLNTAGEINAGTIDSLTGSGALTINGTSSAEDIVVATTTTVGSSTSSTTFSSFKGNLTVNGAAGNDYIKVASKPTDGTLAVNGDAGNDLIIGGGVALTVNGGEGGDLVLGGAYNGTDAQLTTLKTWNGDTAKALLWSTNGTLSDSTVDAASTSANLDGGATGEGNVLYYKGEKLTHDNFDLELTASSTVIVVSAADDTASTSTISMNEAIAAFNASAGSDTAYTIGFSVGTFTAGADLTQINNTKNTLTIDGKNRYDAVTGAKGDARSTAVTLDGKKDDSTKYSLLNIAADNTVTIDTLTVQNASGYGIVNAGTLNSSTLTVTSNGGGGISNSGTLNLSGTGTGDTSSIKITGNTGDGIYNTGDALTHKQTGLYIQGNSGNGINNAATGDEKGFQLGNATITGNTLRGILNTWAFYVGDGTTTTEVTVSGNTGGGITNSNSGNKGGDESTGFQVKQNAMLNITGHTADTGAAISNTSGKFLVLGTLNVQGNTSSGTEKAVINNNGEYATFTNRSENKSVTDLGTITIGGNSAGIYNSSNSKLELKSTSTGTDALIKIQNNTGYGILNDSAELQLTGVTITNNVGFGLKNTGSATKYNQKDLYISGTTKSGTTETDGDGIVNTGTMTIANNKNYIFDNAGTGITNSGEMTLKGTVNIGINASNAAAGNTGRGIVNTTTGTFNVGDGSTTTTVTVANNTAGGIENNKAFNVKSGATLNVENHTGTDNAGVVHFGAGIYNKAGTFEVVSGGVLNVSGNKGRSTGGGIYNAGTLTITGTSATKSTISGNSVTENKTGGGIYTNGKANLTYVTIEGDGTDALEATYGGGLVVQGNTTTLNNVEIMKLNATGGGGIIVDGDSAELVIADATSVHDNTATGQGGGIQIQGGTLTISTSKTLEVKDNSANEGGGIWVGYVDYSYVQDESTVWVHHVGNLVNEGTLTVESNSATGNGGGIAVVISDNSGNDKTTSLTSTGTLTVGGDATDTGNTASQGAGIYNTGTLTLTGNAATASSSVKIQYNTGEGIYNDSKYMKLTNVAIMFNTKDGIYNTKDTTKASDDTTAVEQSGLYIQSNGDDGIEQIADSKMVINGATIISNKANGINNAGTMTLTGTVQIGGKDGDGNTKRGISNTTGTFYIGKAADDTTANVTVEYNEGGGIENQADFVVYKGTTLNVQNHQGDSSASGVADNGAGIKNAAGTFKALGTLNVKGNFTDDEDDRLGGGVYNAGTFTNVDGDTKGTVTIGDSGTGEANKATYGAGIYNDTAGTLTLKGDTEKAATSSVKIQNNTGEGIYNAGENLSLTNVAIMSNEGVGLWNAAKVTGYEQSGLYVYQNKDDGIDNYSDDTTEISLKISNSTITENEGFGIFNGGEFFIGNGTDTTVTVSKNFGVYNKGDFTVNANATLTVKENTGSIDDYKKVGGIYNDAYTYEGDTYQGTLINNGTIEVLSNQGEDVGGIYNAIDPDDNTNKAEITNNGTMTVSGNSSTGADSKGGGIYNAGTFTSTGTMTVSGNSSTGADSKGGGIYNAGTFTSTGTLTVGGTAAADKNTAKDGAGIYNDTTGTMSITSTNTGTAESPVYTQISIASNEATGNGAGIYNEGTLSLVGKNTGTADVPVYTVQIDNNTASGTSSEGGAIYTSTGTVLLQNVMVSNNTSNFATGGIRIKSGSLTNVKDNVSGGLTVYKNSAKQDAGILNDGTLTLTGTDTVKVLIDSNKATDKAVGGISNKNELTLTKVTISNNTANTYCGGLYTAHDATLESLTFIGNTSNGNGGAIEIISGTTTMTGENVIGTMTDKEENKAKDGAGIYIYGGTFKLASGTLDIVGNEASANGGAVYVTKNGTFTNEGTLTITGNTATTNGGGVFNAGTFESTGTLTIGKANTGSGATEVVNANKAVDGAGIYNDTTGEVNISSTNTAGTGEDPVYTRINIENNIASGNGGGIYNTNSLTLSGQNAGTTNPDYTIQIKDNKTTGASGCGGAIWTSNTTGLSNVLIADTVNGDTDPNEAEYGAGLYINGETTTITNTVEIKNLEATNGAGAYVNAGTLSVQGTLNIHGNNATSNGGGIYNKATFTVENLDGTTTAKGTLNVYDNAAANGAGLYNAQNGTFTADYSATEAANNSIVRFNGNVATAAGGGIYNENGANVYAVGYVNIDSNYANAAGNKNTTGIASANLGGGVYNAGTFYTMDSSKTASGHVTIGASSDATEGSQSYTGSTGNYAYNGAGVYNTADGELLLDGARGGGYLVYLTNNTATNFGGGVYTAGTAELSNTVIAGDNADGTAEAVDGAGLYVNISDDTKVVKVADLTIKYLKASNNGAGIYVNDGKVNYADDSNTSNIQNNKAENGAGAYITENGELYVNNTTLNITANAATTNGGGVYNNGKFESTTATALTIGGATQSTDKNTATNGAGIYNDENGTLTLTGANAVTDVMIQNNVASENGGGIYTKGTTSLTNVTISGTDTTASSITNDSEATYGGGIYIDGGTTTTSETVNINTLDAFYGAGVFVGTGTLNVEGTLNISNNEANYGAGISNSDQVNVVKGKGTLNVFGNEALVNGGGIYNSGTFTNDSSTTLNVYYNQAKWYGAGVYNHSGIFKTTENGVTRIYNNLALKAGAGIYNTSSAKVTNEGKTYIYGNYANDGGTMSYSGTITAGDYKATNLGGGIYNAGIVENAKGNLYIGTDDGTTAKANYSYNGAGVYNDGNGTVTFTAGMTTILGNEAKNDGAGIYQNSTAANGTEATITLNDKVKILENHAENNGAGVYVNAKTNLANGTTALIYDNAADKQGGAFYIAKDKTLAVTGDSLIGGNTTAEKQNEANQGAGIYNAGTLDHGDYTLTISYNKATADDDGNNGDGGGIYQAGTITKDLNEKLFVTNNEAVNGGGVYVAAVTTLANGTTNTITENTAKNDTVTGKGGGIYVAANKTLTYETSNIGGTTSALGNKADNGGGLYLAGILVNKDNIAELKIQNNDTTASKQGYGAGLYIASTGKYNTSANGNFVLNRQKDFHFINNGHYTNEADATRGGAIYNAYGSTLYIANTNYGFGVSVTGEKNDSKTVTANTEQNTGIGAAVYNAGTFSNASEYQTFHAGGIDTTDTGYTVDTTTHKTYSFYVTGQKGESAFASSGSTTLNNAKIYGNATGGLRVEAGLTTLTQGTEIGTQTFIQATTAYANYASGFTGNSGYGVKVTGGKLQSTEASTSAKYTNKRKNTGVAGSDRYQDYSVADTVQISGNSGTAIIVSGNGQVFLNDVRAESNGSGLEANTTATSYITNALIEGAITNTGVTLVNATTPTVTASGQNVAGNGTKFTSDELGNKYTLDADFDAIDKGTNANAVYHFADGSTRTISHDLGGHDRIINGTVDLGAFECPISWIISSMYIDDIKYAVENCVEVDFGGKVKFDTSCNGKTFVWNPGVSTSPDYDPTWSYVEKDTIIDARYEEVDGTNKRYYWMDITLDAEKLSPMFRVTKRDVTLNVYGLTVKNAVSEDSLRPGGAFMVAEMKGENGSVINLYGVSCINCESAAGGAVYAGSNSIVNLYGAFTADGYMTGTNNNAKSETGTWYLVNTYSGNSSSKGGAIYAKNGKSSTTIGGVEYKYGLNIEGVDLEDKQYLETGFNSDPTNNIHNTGVVYDTTTKAVKQYSVQFISNTSDQLGGAVAVDGKASIENVSFIGNSAPESNTEGIMAGGAMHVAGTVEIQNADFLSNSSYNNGGAVAVTGTFTSDGNLVFAGNSTNFSGTLSTGNQAGGAIAVEGGTVTLKSEKKTAIRKKALYENGLTVIDGKGTEFVNNEGSLGGAVFVASGKLDATDVLFQRNKAVGGGAIYNGAGTVNLTGAEMKQNYATNSGGAIFNTGTFTGTISTMTENCAANYGAIFSGKGYSATVPTTGNYAFGKDLLLYYNAWIKDYADQEESKCKPATINTKLTYFGKSGVTTKNFDKLDVKNPYETTAEASLVCAPLGEVLDGNALHASLTDWDVIYAQVALGEDSVKEGYTTTQTIEFNSSAFSLGKLNVAEGWKGEISQTENEGVTTVKLTLTAEAEYEGVQKVLANLEILPTEAGLSEEAEILGTRVEKVAQYDLDGNANVGINDLVMFARMYNATAEGDAKQADFDGNGKVGIEDLVMFARHYGNSKSLKLTDAQAAQAAPSEAVQTVLPQEVKLDSVEEEEETPVTETEILAPVAAAPVKATANEAVRDAIFGESAMEEDWFDEMYSELNPTLEKNILDDLFED